MMWDFDTFFFLNRNNLWILREEGTSKENAARAAAETQISVLGIQGNKNIDMELQWAGESWSGRRLYVGVKSRTLWCHK